jgi:DNA-binding PadR family transcriptional regulator
MAAGYLSYSATAILQAVANGYQYGFDIMDVTGLPSGTVYPALRRLEHGDLVASKWEKHEVAQNESRPPRKYYTLTKDGEHALTDAARRYRLLEPPRRARVGRPLRERG